MNQNLVIIVAPIHDVLKQALLDGGYKLEYHNDINNPAFEASLADVEGIVTSTKVKMNRAFLDKCPQLKWVGRLGSGMEHIDLEYALQKGIQCFSSPAGNANAVAEQALGSLLALNHNITRSFDELKQNIWLRDENRGTELEAQTIGIIGVGNNGGRFAEKLITLGAKKVIGYDKYKKHYGTENLIEATSLQQIYDEADVISFHVPLTEETHHYFDQKFLENMKKPFTLLNLCRGKVTDQQIILNGLKKGKIKAAALDVWEVEPIANMDAEMKQIATELLAQPNFIGTAHIAGYSHEASYKMSAIIAEYIKNL